MRPDKDMLTGVFEKLGRRLRAFQPESGETADPVLADAVVRASAGNPWFTPGFTAHALRAIGTMLERDGLVDWLSAYTDIPVGEEFVNRVGVIPAGNIPAAGFHDFLCVIMAGHRYIGKLSSRDQVLLPVLAGILTGEMPELQDRIQFTEGKLEHPERVIATGSNNSSRYFEYYFRKIPSVIRKNRNGVAVLTGGEREEDLRNLAHDVLMYYGLGCRSVSKLFVPAGYDVTSLFRHWESYSFAGDHHKYRNNYDYNKSILLVNRELFFDNGFLLLKKEKQAISSPVSVLYYDEYDRPGTLLDLLQRRKEEIQCVVGPEGCHPDAIPFGRSQFPGAGDYPDGVDILAFLTKK